MTSEIQWLINERVIYVKLSGEITIEDLQRDNQQVIEMMSAGEPPVHGIMDDGEVQNIPLSINDLSRVLKVFRHPGRGWLIAIGGSGGVQKLILSLMTQFFRAQFQRFESLEEALDFLREQDTTLDWSKADTSVLGEQLARR